MVKTRDILSGHRKSLEGVLSTAGVFVCHVSPTGDLLFDEAARARLGMAEDSRLPALLRCVDRSHRRRVVEMMRGLQARAEHGASEFQWVGPDGRQWWFRVIARRFDEHCDDDCVMVTLLDVTQDREALEALRQSEEHLRYTVELNPQLPWIADPQGRIIDVTDRWLNATGMTREVALGEGWLSVTHPEDQSKIGQEITDSLSSGKPFDVRVRLSVNGEYRWMRAQGYPRRDEQGNITRWYGYTEDIHEHALVAEQIRWNAEHDPLTDLANRTLFNTRLEEALLNAYQDLCRVGILLIDLDNFKEVNDLLGHQTGDELLIDYAGLLRSALPSDALIARFGGDEFAVLLPKIHRQDELLECADRLLHLRQPVSASGGPIDCRASIGASIFPDHGRNPSELLRHADIALYAAKDAGRGKRLMFEARMQDEVRERSAMVSRARTAVDSGDVVAFYQPKVLLATGELAGFEALLRWRDSNGQIHSPGMIAAAFEDPEVADMLGQAMLENIIKDVTGWERHGIAYRSVAVNAAPAEFRRNNFALRLINALKEAGLSSRAIEVEVTEGVFLGRGAGNARHQITLLHEHGIPIALDDFGTGFASLSHLRALPVDTLKIDRSFIANINAAGSDRAIVTAIIRLGRSLGIKVVAEGIETLEQAEILRSLDCDAAQGFYFGVPTASQQIPELIRTWDRGATPAPVLPIRSAVLG